MVGIARRVSQHKAESRRDKRRPICRWIQKHGEGNICAVEIERTTKAHIDVREMYWIASFRQRGYGLLNATDGGQGPNGAVSSPETRAAIGKAGLGRLVSIETRDKISLANTGRVASPETRRRITEALLRRDPMTDATKAKMSESRMGHVVTLETRRKISDTATGKARTPEDIAKQVVTRTLRRTGRGELHPNARLDWEKVHAIRARPNDSTADLGLEFGVKADTIRKIRRGVLWPEVEFGLRFAA